MSTSEVESRNITIQMRKSVENLVLSSQDAIGQSISQALNFSGVISQHTSQLIQDSKSASRAPSPSPRNIDNSTEALDNDKLNDASLIVPNLSGGDNISVSSNEAITVVSPTSLRNDNSKSSTPNPRGGDATRAKKKSWYNSLYPTYKNKLDDFKRLFKDLPDDERLIVDYSCALQKDILAQGRLYASQNYLCFYAYILGWETSLTLRWKDITAITKERTALVIPNAILVCTEKEKHFLTSITGRDKAYLMLFRIWQNALMDQPMTSQDIWQWVHSCYGEELGFNSDEEYMREGAEDLSSAPDIADKDLLDSSSMEASGGGDSKEENKSSRSASRGRDSSPPLVHNGDAEEREDALPTDMSDTSESEPDKPNNDADIEQCTDPHDGKLILNGKFPFNIDTLFTMIFTNSKFQLELLAERGTTDYVESPWQVQNGRKYRQTSYKLSLSTGPIGPKEVQVTETQVMNKCSKPGVMYSIECQSENSGIPYADHVTVLVHYCLRRVPDCSSATHLALYAKLRYRRSMWPVVKAFMEKSTMGGLDEFSRLLEARLNAEAESAVPAARKARRHRRGTGHSAVPAVPVLSVPARAASPARAAPAPRWPLLALLVLLLLNALLYWRLYHADTALGTADQHDSRQEGAAERQAAAQRHQLRAWAHALHRAADRLLQTEQALMKVLETIKPTLEKVQETQERTEL